MKKKCFVNKYLHILLATLILLAVVTRIEVCAYADKGDSFSLIDEKTECVLDSFKDILPDGFSELYDPDESAYSLGIDFLLEGFIREVRGEMGEVAIFLLSLLGLAMMMALSSIAHWEVAGCTRAAVCTVCASVILDRIFALSEVIGESLSEINTFFAALIPIVASVNALGVSAGAATTQAAGMSITLRIYSFFSGNFLFSFVGIMLIIAALGAMDPSTFGKIASSVRKTFMIFMGLLTTCIGATFSLQSLIVSSTDSTALRGARYAVSGMIPIVGGTISSALGTLIGAVSYLKGAIGGGAIAAIIALALAPLVTLILYRTCFSIAIFFLGVCGADYSEGILSSFAFAIDALIAVYTLTVTIYVAQLVAFVKGGVALA